MTERRHGAGRDTTGSSDTTGQRKGSDMTETVPASNAGQTGRARASQERRKEIFEAAARIFSEKGYAATSIQDVADAVGILKGSLYYYIDSKEDLLYGVIQDAHETGLANLERVEGLAGNALVKLRYVIEAHLRSNIENLVKVGVFFHDFRSLSGQRHDYIIQERDQYDQRIRQLIREGQEEGVITPDIDPKIATLAILGMVNWVYQWYRPMGPESPEELASTFADLVLGGLAADSRRPKTRREIGAPPAPKRPKGKKAASPSTDGG